MYPTLTSDYIKIITDQEIVNVFDPATEQLVPMRCRVMGGNVMPDHIFFTTLDSRADEYQAHYRGDYSEESGQQYRNHIHHIRSLTDKAAMSRETFRTILETNAYIIG